jgi:hypothetical protein
MRWIAVALVIGSLAGCNTPWGQTPPIPLPTPTPTPTVAPTPMPDPYAQDDLDLSNVSWFGADYSRAKIATRILSARTNGKTVWTDYEPYGGAGWPVMFGDTPKPCDAIICLFYREAGVVRVDSSGRTGISTNNPSKKVIIYDWQVVGGKFDWWRVGGQREKGLENVHSGYGGHTGLIPGAECWEMIVSTDGKLRSNVRKVEWR